MKNLICGYGNIGKHILKEFASISDSFKIYDKYISRYNSTELLNEYYNFAFVCVPTEMKENG